MIIEKVFFNKLMLDFITDEAPILVSFSIFETMDLEGITKDGVNTMNQLLLSSMGMFFILIELRIYSIKFRVCFDNTWGEVINPLVVKKNLDDPYLLRQIYKGQLKNQGKF